MNDLPTNARPTLLSATAIRAAVTGLMRFGVNAVVGDGCSVHLAANLTKPGPYSCPPASRSETLVRGNSSASVPSRIGMRLGGSAILPLAAAAPSFSFAGLGGRRKFARLNTAYTASPILTHSHSSSAIRATPVVSQQQGSTRVRDEASSKQG